jgi:redox-sensing transcriptional repressor
MVKKNDNRDFSQIPRVVIKRLFKYHSALENLLSKGTVNVSSKNLSEDVHVKASQLRKDLAYCGEFGTRGKGYDVTYLNGKLAEILGLQTEWNYILAGFGHVGTALVSYEGILRKGFKVKGIFDIDEKKIGQVFRGIEICDISKMPEIVREHNVQIGVITVPSDSGQSVCDKMIEAGITAILNFAPVFLKPKKSIFIERVDISRELVTLSHYLSHHKK